MDDIKRVRHPHAVRMEDRKKAQFTGITDVVSFEPSKVILESGLWRYCYKRGVTSR